MDSLQVDLAGNFIEKDTISMSFPVGAERRKIPRRRRLYDLGAWSFGHDVRKGAHEHMIASQRLEIAGRKCDDLI